MFPFSFPQIGFINQGILSIRCSARGALQRELFPFGDAAPRRGAELEGPAGEISGASAEKASGARMVDV